MHGFHIGFEPFLSSMSNEINEVEHTKRRLHLSYDFLDKSGVRVDNYANSSCCILHEDAMTSILSVHEFGLLRGLDRCQNLPQTDNLQDLLLGCNQSIWSTASLTWSTSKVLCMLPSQWPHHCSKSFLLLETFMIKIQIFGSYANKCVCSLKSEYSGIAMCECEKLLYSTDSGVIGAITSPQLAVGSRFRKQRRVWMIEWHYRR